MADWNIETEQELFEAALRFQDPKERERYLASACDGDSELQQRVSRLIAAASSAEKFFAVPDIVAQAASTNENQQNEQIGNYRILARIGAGGEGVVFEAFQEEPVRRTVAIKVMKGGLHSNEAIARFLAERQALALMEHPGIAQIFDAGATEDGSPYFVMERVRGVRITNFADEARMPVRSRIEMFIQVCNAVQHAHQKGVIHRDLKPANILVNSAEPVPYPKIIDFGIAKALGSTSQLEKGASEMISGTPAYMSPEQVALNDDVDTRSDIYSLGVVLYELLVGSPPFDPRELRGASLEKMRRMICDSVIVSPFQKFLSFSRDDKRRIAAERSSSTSFLGGMLRGDLATIVLKCLEKNREARYSSARELAEDLRRYVLGEPVIARPATRAYKTWKFVGKHKLAVGAACTVAVVLIGAVISTTTALIREKRTAQEAEVARLRERRQRLRAEAGELNARRFAYASEINSAQQAFDLNNRGRARELLTRNIPKGSELDLRGWEWRLLWEATRNNSIDLVGKGESSAFTALFAGHGIAVVRDGNFYITTYDTLAGQTLDRFYADGFGRAIAADQSSGYVAYAGTVGRKPVIKIRNIAAKRDVDEFLCDALPSSLAFGPNRQFLGGTCIDGYGRVWQVGERTEIGKFKMSTDDAWNKGATAFTSSGELVAFGGSDGKVLIVETKKGSILTNFQASPQGITCLCFSKDDRWLAAGSGFTDSKVRIWNPQTATEIATLPGHESWVSSIKFSPDGRWLATASGDQTIRIWNCSSWKQISVLRGNSDEVYSIDFSADGTRLISGSKSGEVLLWDASMIGRAEEFSEIPGISTFKFLPTQSGVLAVRDNGALVTIRSDSVSAERVIANVGPHSKIDCRDDIAAIATSSGELQLFDVSKAQLLRTAPIGGGDPLFVQFATEGVFVIDATHTATLWGPDLKPVTSWAMPSNAVSFALSPKGEVIAAGSNRGELRLVKVKSGSMLKSVAAHSRVISSIAFDPSGRFLASGSEDARVKVWRVSDLTEEFTLRGHILAVHSVGFSPDGSRIVSASADKQAVKLWEPLTRQELITLKGTGDFFRDVSFSPDGNTLGTVNGKGTLHLWSAGAK